VRSLLMEAVKETLITLIHRLNVVNSVKPESVFQIICSNETTILLMCFQ
jgi:hypothetical protein